MKASIRSTVLGLFVLIVCSSASAQQPVPAEPAAQPRISKKVLAFYYGWYANPQVSGRWDHWENVDADAKRISNSTNYPQLGAYDSHSPQVLEQHCKWAKEAGVDGFIASWWGRRNFTNKGVPLLLDTAKKSGMEVSVYLETVRDKSREEALKDVLYLLDNYSKHPAWLKLNGKPVIFIYGRAIEEIGLDGWYWVMLETYRRRDGGAVFIGDQLSRDGRRAFDAVHTYNIAGETTGKSAEEIGNLVREKLARRKKFAPLDRVFCATIIPGYDDSKVSKDQPGPITNRHNGQTYRSLWETAIEANPDWVLITSWNEWHEGSEIEPSVENGDRELKTTAEFSKKFKALPQREAVDTK